MKTSLLAAPQGCGNFYFLDHAVSMLQRQAAGSNC